MAASNHKQQGFSLIELVAYTGIYLLLTLLLLPCAESLGKISERSELEGFCQQLAAEVTALQQASLWKGSLQNKIVLDLNNQSYTVYRNGVVQKKVRLKEIGRGKLYFYSPTTSVVRFSDEGAPKAYFSVYIKNRQSPILVRKFEVQPVTGRVVISESK